MTESGTLPIRELQALVAAVKADRYPYSGGAITAHVREKAILKAARELVNRYVDYGDQ